MTPPPLQSKDRASSSTSLFACKCGSFFSRKSNLKRHITAYWDIHCPSLYSSQELSEMGVKRTLPESEHQDSNSKKRRPLISPTTPDDPPTTPLCSLPESLRQPTTTNSSHASDDSSVASFPDSDEVSSPEEYHQTFSSDGGDEDFDDGLSVNNSSTSKSTTDERETISCMQDLRAQKERQIRDTFEEGLKPFKVSIIK